MGKAGKGTGSFGKCSKLRERGAPQNGLGIAGRTPVLMLLRR